MYGEDRKAGDGNENDVDIFSDDYDIDENTVDIVDGLLPPSNLAAVHAGGFATGIYQTNRLLGFYHTTYIYHISTSLPDKYKSTRQTDREKLTEIHLRV